MRVFDECDMILGFLFVFGSEMWRAPALVFAQQSPGEQQEKSVEITGIEERRSSRLDSWTQLIRCHVSYLCSSLDVVCKTIHELHEEKTSKTPLEWD
jgi:hypothetical protein